MAVVDAQLRVHGIAGLRVADASIMTAPAMTPFQMSELAPGADRTTDDEILDWVKKAAETTYHPVGTCKMGSDPMAVVDAQLRVHGIAGLRVADASIMTAPAMTPFQMSELAPGADRTTDDEILDWVKKAAETTYHPVGTCKMGSDPMAVVDAQLRVHGIAGLRVADASIMPTLTSGNTNAPSIMIGEKAADMVLNTAT